MPKLDHLRPSGLHHNPAYSHVVTASGARTIYISGQVSVDEEGRIVGEGDIAAQTTQVMQNLGHALKAAGASYSNIVKITTFVVNYKPELRPIIEFSTVITTIGLLTSMFGLIYVLTGGGPGTATTVPEYLIWSAQGRLNQPAYAAALSIILFVITSLLAALQIRMMSRNAKL